MEGTRMKRMPVSKRIEKYREPKHKYSIETKSCGIVRLRNCYAPEIPYLVLNGDRLDDPIIVRSSRNEDAEKKLRIPRDSKGLTRRNVESGIHCFWIGKICNLLNIKGVFKPVETAQTCKKLKRGCASRRIFTPLVIKIKRGKSGGCFGNAWLQHASSRTFRHFRTKKKTENNGLA